MGERRARILVRIEIEPRLGDGTCQERTVTFENPLSVRAQLGELEEIFREMVAASRFYYGIEETR